MIIVIEIEIRAQEQARELEWRARHVRDVDCTVLYMIEME